MKRTLIILILATIKLQLFSQLFNSTWDNPAEKDFGIHVAVGYGYRFGQGVYDFEGGATYCNDFFGLYYRYYLSKDDLFRKKVEGFNNVPNFNQRHELSGGINLFSWEGSATCFQLLQSGGLSEIWGVGGGDAVNYLQPRGGIGLMTFLYKTNQYAPEPTYYANSWTIIYSFNSEAWAHMKIPYYFVGLSKIKKFAKDCNNTRYGIHKLYFDFVFGNPEITGFYTQNGYADGYISLLKSGKLGWRFGYEAVRLNWFGSFLSIEAGYMPGFSEADGSDWYYSGFRVGFASGLF